MKSLVFDLEANGLLDTADTLWVFCGRELNGDTVVQYVGHEEILSNIPRVFKDYKILIGHNILGYDIPLVTKLYNNIYNIYNNNTIIDTLVLSRLLFPDRVGGHGLEAWGDRFKMKKVENERWDVFDPIMIERCQMDVAINERVYNRLAWEMEQ